MNLLYFPILLATTLSMPLFGAPPKEDGNPCKEGEAYIRALVVQPQMEDGDIGIGLCLDPTKPAEPGVKINSKDPRTWKVTMREIVMFKNDGNAVEL